MLRRPYKTQYEAGKGLLWVLFWWYYCCYFFVKRPPSLYHTSLNYTIPQKWWAVIPWRRPLPPQIWAMGEKISLVGLSCAVRMEFALPPPPPLCSGDIFLHGEVTGRSKSTVLPVLHLLQGTLLHVPQAVSPWAPLQASTRLARTPSP